MKVAILCGGFGTRIRDVADDIPKPLVPVGGLPILWHIMKGYSAAGFDDFVLCLGYKGSAIKDFFLDYQAHTSDFTIRLGAKSKIAYHGSRATENWSVTLADTGNNSMTGDRVRNVRKYLAGEKTFMLTYGDGVSNIDLQKLLAFHKKHGRILTVTGVRPPGRFGEIVTERGGRITEFNEKPQTTGGRISGGFFVCDRRLFDYLPNEDGLVFEQEPLRALVEEGQLMMYEHDGFWQCMDTARDYALLNKLYDQGDAPWVTWANSAGKRSSRKARA